MSAAQVRDWYSQDQPSDLYNELKEGELDIARSASHLKGLAVEKTRAKAEYESEKNRLLIEMFTEENSDKSKKRTVDQRQAEYRHRFAELRLLWQLAENNYDAEKTYCDALLSLQISREVRLKLLDYDGRMGGRIDK